MKRTLIAGGRLIDRGRGFHGEMKDILVEDGKIKQIGTDLKREEGMEVVQLSGSWVSPGFIDAHVHVYTRVALGVPADEIGVEKGTTTVVDAGSAGPQTMADFIERDIKTSKTRIFAAMHYAKDGLLDPPEADEESKYDLDLAREAYGKYKDYIVAIKGRASNSCVGSLGITSIKAGKKLASDLGIPYMVHIGNMPPLIEEVLELMETGDVITHAFHGKKNNLFDDGKIKPETQKARDQNVIFDVGHGKDSFNFNVGRQAKELGFYPDIISTDLHALNYHGPVYSLSVTLDKMLALGYSLEECIEKATERPAEVYGLSGLGKLEEGYLGDFTVFDIEEGAYEFQDSNGNKLHGSQSIKVQYAIVGGEIAYQGGESEK